MIHLQWFLKASIVQDALNHITFIDWCESIAQNLYKHILTKQTKHISTCNPGPRTLNQSELLSILPNHSCHLLLLLAISWRKYLVRLTMTAGHLKWTHYWIWRTIAIPLVSSLHENIEIYFRIGVFVDQIHCLTSTAHAHLPFMLPETGKNCVSSCKTVAKNKFLIGFSMFDAGFGAFDQNHHFLNSYVENWN